jgi:hypothetical protein
VTVRDDLPSDVLAMFTDPELAEIAERKPQPGDAKPDALGFARAWDLHVQKIDDDRALPRDDRSVWTEHDLAAMLFMRDFVEDALGRLRPELAGKVRGYVARTDDRFRSVTTEDSGVRMGTIAQVELAGRGWWWFRVPDSGPILQDLATYPEG